MLRLSLFLLPVLLAAQAPPGNPVAGMIRSIGSRSLQLRSGPATLVFLIDAETCVCGVRTVSGLHEGDRVRITWRADAAGKMTAAMISTPTDVRGFIASQGSKAWNGDLKLLVDGKDRRSAISVGSSTKMAVSKTLLTPAQEVHVSGWDTCNETVDADSIAIYNTDAPLSRE